MPGADPSGQPSPGSNQNLSKLRGRMSKNNVAVEDAVPPLTPDMVAKIKKDDMKQAIVERFGGRTKPPETRTPTWTGKRS
jgi:hypothetical protein